MSFAFRPPPGETFPAEEFSFTLGLLAYHFISILETAVCKVGVCSVVEEEALP